VLGGAASLFLVFESAIVVGILGYRSPSRVPGRVRVVALELVWTVIPVVLVGALFLLSWQPAALAAP
jgi:heme/copper-type cytochrome/quinol oxidase subunit 2